MVPQNEQLDAGPEPPDLTNDLVSLVTPVVFDTPKWNHKFGDCLLQPNGTFQPLDTITAKFVSIKQTLGVVLRERNGMKSMPAGRRETGHSQGPT